MCGEGAAPRLGGVLAHFGEEPPISGTRGSGTLFFCGCGVGCFFCQNDQISRGGVGRTYDGQGLLAAALGLAATGVHNLNFVTPAPHWPTVAWLARRLRAAGCTLPLVCNCSGYHEAVQVAAFTAEMDIFLPDFKFARPALAAECMGDARYPALALAAIEAMIAARGYLEPFDPSGGEPARTGVLVRHLVLPGEVENSLEALRQLRRQFGRFLPLALMSQFVPRPACHARQRFTRRVTAAEYETVVDEAVSLGFESLLIQPVAADEDFLPDFERSRPFKGNPAPER